MLVLLIGPLLSQSLIQEVHINHYTESPNKHTKKQQTKPASPHESTTFLWRKQFFRVFFLVLFLCFVCLAIQYNIRCNMVIVNLLYK